MPLAGRPASVTITRAWTRVLDDVARLPATCGPNPGGPLLAVTRHRDVEQKAELRTALASAPSLRALASLGGEPSASSYASATA
jgi:hypothetical protein